VFASNRLEIVVGRGNPRHIAGLPDLAQAGLIRVLAAPQVPAGRYAAEALARAGVRATPRSLETDVRSVVSKVALGEARLRELIKTIGLYRTKAKNVKPEHNADYGDTWPVVAIDADTKLMISWVVGGRDAGYANAMPSCKTLRPG